MIPWPLDVEDAPKLVDLSIFIHSPAAGVHSHRYQSSRHGSSLSGLDPNIDSCHVADTWLPLQGVKVVRLSSLPFTEDQERLSRPAGRNSPFERPSSGPLTISGHHASLDA